MKVPPGPIETSSLPATQAKDGAEFPQPVPTKSTVSAVVAAVQVDSVKRPPSRMPADSSRRSAPLPPWKEALVLMLVPTAQLAEKAPMPLAAGMAPVQRREGDAAVSDRRPRTAGQGVGVRERVGVGV